MGKKECWGPHEEKGYPQAFELGRKPSIKGLLIEQFQQEKFTQVFVELRSQLYMAKGNITIIQKRVNNLQKEKEDLKSLLRKCSVRSTSSLYLKKNIKRASWGGPLLSQEIEGRIVHYGGQINENLLPFFIGAKEYIEFLHLGFDLTQLKLFKVVCDYQIGGWKGGTSLERGISVSRLRNHEWARAKQGYGRHSHGRVHRQENILEEPLAMVEGQCNLYPWWIFVTVTKGFLCNYLWCNYGSFCIF